MISKKGVKVINKNLFIDTSAYVLEYSLDFNGEEIYKNFIQVLVKAGDEKYIELELPEVNIPGEYAVNARFKLKENILWAEAGHVVAFDQYVYSLKGKKARKS